MPYVGSDGSLQEKPPITRRIVNFFVVLWTAIVFYFKTMFGDFTNADSKKRGGGSSGGGSSDGRSPPPGGPRNRGVGRVARMSDICMPGGG